MSKQKNNFVKKVKKFITAPTTAIVIGAVLLSISLSHWYFKYQSLSFNQELVAQYSQASENEGAIPVNISIPWFVDTGISTEVFAQGQWTISENQASYLEQSARPGESGNIIIYGHNKREILGNIRALKGYETIAIETKDGSIHEYKIENISEVDPDQTSFLEPTETETLTLYTCSGFLDKKRFIVQAKPITTQNDAANE